MQASQLSRDDPDGGPLHLVLVHSPGWQDMADFHKIARHVEQLAPEIRVYIVANNSKNVVTRKQAATNPTLIVSPLALKTFRPLRGRVFAGTAMSKLEEMRRLRDAGLPVPDFEEIRPGLSLSQERFGPLTIVKPSYAFASWGQDLKLTPTAEVRYQPPESFPEWHHGRKAPMIAQTFINTGRAMSCRVLTLFGEPIFTYCRQSTRPVNLDGRDGGYASEDYLPMPETSTASIVKDPDMLALARAAYAAIPEAPLQGCDILRDAAGALHILEVNPGGGTWAFSNSNTQGYRDRLGVADLTEAFDAFRACARVLVDKTRRMAA